MPVGEGETHGLGMARPRVIRTKNRKEWVRCLVEATACDLQT